MKKINKEQKNDDYVVCVHCHKKFNEARLMGITLLCPFCNKPSDELILKSLGKSPL
jgi:uncharacterized CHY-type Zn-finger protein